MRLKERLALLDNPLIRTMLSFQSTVIIILLLHQMPGIVNNLFLWITIQVLLYVCHKDIGGYSFKSCK